MTPDGFVSLVSLDPYAQTVSRLDRALVARSIVPILRLDHAAAAAGAGLSLRPLLLLVFGDPAVGAELMRDAPTIGIDLPLKLLVWQDRGGVVRISYNDPAWVAARHGVDPAAAALPRMAMLLAALASAAAEGTPP